MTLIDFRSIANDYPPNQFNIPRDVEDSPGMLRVFKQHEGIKPTACFINDKTRI